MKPYWIPFVMLFYLPSLGGDNFSKIHVFQTFYSGKEFKTFSNENPGAGLEISTSTMNDQFNWIAKGRLTTISGTQDFLDAGVERSSDFTFYQSSFEGGFTIYPLSRKKRGMNLYFGLSAIMSFNYLQLDSSSFTVLQPAYQSTGFGFSGLAGIEWFIFEKVCLSAEFGQRYETANLAKQSAFDLGGFSLALGIGW